MISQLLIIFVLGAWVLYRFISLRHEYPPKDFWIFILLTVIGIILNVAQISGAKLPVPTEFIAWVYKPLTDFLMKILE